MDDIGAAVAATDKPLHYTMADKEYWEAIYAGGRWAMSRRNPIFPCDWVTKRELGDREPLKHVGALWTSLAADRPVYGGFSRSC
jgi:hypothetical protein